MMFASRYRLAPHDAKALRVTDTYSLHRVVYGLFDDVREGDREKGSGILFVDMGGDKYGRQLLILSDRQPREPEYGEFDRTEPIPEAFFGFSAYRFEIVVNPVKRDSRTQKRTPLCNREDITRWFLEKAPSWGFEVQESSFQVAEINADVFWKGEQKVTLGKARVTGTLTVVDKERFTQSVCRGIGHGKAFGCGLLQVAPIVF